MTKIVYASLIDATQNLAILDLIPDTHVWVKDCEGYFVFGNRLFIERFGFSTVEGLMGKDDFSLSSATMARHYRDDDDVVLRGGVVTDRLELIGGINRDVEWFLTSKWPIYDTKDHVIGSIGISRHLNQSERSTLPYRELGPTIDYITEHFASNITISDLASACNVSISALERRFRKHFGKPPHQYLTDIRLEHARHLLQESDKAVGTIALETGFSDHSHFTRSFRRRYGLSPREERCMRSNAQMKQD